MTFSVAVDGSRWQAHQDSVVDAIVHASGNIPVPVIKGNGYGLGPHILAREAMRIGADTIAVGTVFEVDDVAEPSVEPIEERRSAGSDDGAAAELREQSVVDGLERLPVRELHAQ